MTTPKQRGTAFEYYVLYILKKYFPLSYRVPVSGASQGMKGDIVAGDFLIECKKTLCDSIRIRKLWLQKIVSEAKRAGKIPALVFSLNRTEPFIILPLRTFLDLIKSRKA